MLQRLTDKRNGGANSVSMSPDTEMHFSENQLLFQLSEQRLIYSSIVIIVNKMVMKIFFKTFVNKRGYLTGNGKTVY